MSIGQRTTVAAAMVFAAARIAAGQTVIVRNAPPGAPTELVFNADRVATATADSTGTATLTADMMSGIQKSETGVHVSVDRCGQQRRVLLVESGAQAAAQVGCTRGTVRDLFSLQKITTLVVDVTGDNPLVWIRQGPAPPEWIGEAGAEKAPSSWAAPPLGIILSGGVGGATFSNAITQACGDAPTCTGNSVRLDATAGITYWFTRNLALDIGFLRPGSVKANGSGDTFTFDSALDARVITIDGKVGTQVGPMRLYALGGMNHLSAASTTLQTITSGGSGTETFAFKADGWSWMAGGGMEMWLLPRVGFYLEGNVLSLKGTAVDNGQGSITDTLIYGTAGVRVAIGRKSSITAR
jgi:hypothetical protein